MEEEILNILIKNKNWVELSPKENASAKEITSHIIGFIEWLITNYMIEDNIYWNLLNDPDEPNGSLEELYQYWKDNILKK